MQQDLVLIPGLLCTADLFAPQMTALSAHARVHVADHTVAANMPDIARSILAAAPAKFALCGLSMGGYIASEILRQARERQLTAQASITVIKKLLAAISIIQNRRRVLLTTDFTSRSSKKKTASKEMCFCSAHYF